MKNIVIFLFLTNTLVFSQQNLNSFAYVIVPGQFSFLNEPDQYQLNAMAKFLLEKEGFAVFGAYETLPQELAVLPCGGLFFELKNKSGMLRTKLQFNLLDCHRKKVFESAEGVSREKEFRKAYQASLREAFECLKDEQYQYIPLAKQYTKTIPLDTKLVVSRNKSKTTYINSDGLRIQLEENEGSYVVSLASSGVVKTSSETMICNLVKTSLPNVFKTLWKDTSGNLLQTIAYFDEKGNLNIDVEVSEDVSVMVFEPVL
jgi:hypothetical protein